ncbi:Highly reducing polyketide synthase, partial [Lachnellula suecica]
MPIFQESGSTSPSDIDPKSIAVVGLSCRFPSEASNAESFWEFIKTGKSAYSDASKRWNVDAFHHTVRGRVNTSAAKGAHFLDQDLGAFDAGFFNISHNEAIALDPQQRFMLEITYEAFENAGITLDQLAGSQTGCYVGAYTSDWRETQFRDAESAPLYSINGTGFEFLSDKVSWFYDLKGPSMTIDTACSSSLVALHQACQSLQSGSSNMAIVGGTSLLLNPDVFLYLSNQKFLAQDRRSKSFDAKGDGYGRGEGCAAVILKRVDDAIRDGDPIRAIIRGSGANSDGKTKGITLPSAEAQADLIRRVYRDAGVDMSVTSYVEAHGTGTSAGDPIELRAIAETIGRAHDPDKKVIIGSVKPNIGHLEAAAGLAGLIKSVLALEKAIIPPNILFDTPNPNIPFEKWNLQVPIIPTPWVVRRIRRASVNSFGVGGTNAHVVIDDAENYLLSRGLKHAARIGAPAKQLWKPQPKTSEQKKRLFAISAQDQGGLIRQRQSLAAHLTKIRSTISQEDTYLRNLAYTLGERRSRLPWKSYVIASSIDTLVEGLEKVDPNSLSVRSNQAPRLGFVFTGQGAQWAKMGIELCQYKVFRQSVEAADDYLQSIGAPWSAMEELRKDENESQINLPEFSQPICTVLQIALVDLLTAWNIEPVAMTGHSSGEIAAAYSLGALSKEDAWKVAYWRGILSAQINTHAPDLKGAMLAVGTSEDQANELISKVTKGEINVACVNSDSSVTVSGDVSGIEELQSILQKEGVFERRLKVETAYHSHHMVTISNPYLDAIRDIQTMSSEKGKRMYSSVPGGFVEASELGAVHWVRNLVSPVLFSDAMLELLRPTHSDDLGTGNAVDIVVEVGPHPALGGPVKQILKANNITGVDYRSVISRGKNGVDFALAFAGAMYAQGVAVDMAGVNGDVDDFSAATQTLVNLPPYEWNHTRTFWSESRLNKQYRMREYPRQSLVGAPMPQYGESERLWRGFIRISEEPWIRDHKIQSSILYPAAGFIAMAIEGAFQLADKTREISKFRLRDIQISVAAVVTEDSELEAVLQLRPHLTATRDNSSAWLEFTVSTAASGQDLRQNCSGLLLLQYSSDDHSGPSFETNLENEYTVDQYRQAEATCKTAQSAEKFYENLESLGLGYGPTFRNMRTIHSNNNKHSCCTVEISDPGSMVVSSRLDRPHFIHPATLDAMFHAAFAAKGTMKTAMVPKCIEEIMISADIAFQPGSVFRGYATAEMSGFKDMNSDLHFLDEKL